MMDFKDRQTGFMRRVDARLERTVPPADRTPARLHEAMRYAVLNGGKRIRPQLVYATGECLDIDPAKLDAPAAAIELIHAFSLVHDDLPAMDDDDLRRGKPTVHRKFDEATAILAADALQPLAFETIASDDALSDSEKAALVYLIASACGSLGMTGGQSMDLAAEGRNIDGEELRQMHELKTGALIRASVMSACCLRGDLDPHKRDALERCSNAIGLAFQIRDDILDIEGETAVIGKQVGADQSRAKATWPSVHGLDEARAKCAELLDECLHALDCFGDEGQLLRQLARLIVERER